jgi:septum formation protein|tara:strand:- start:221 stop:793 length:573 start_codon:yes stop_codon:yes gene_type:complete
MKLILGSSSPQRQKILKDMGYDFDIIKPEADEKSVQLNDPKDLALKVSHLKADAVVKKADNNSIVIASDSIVVVDNIVHEKPRDKEQAYQWLAELSQGAPQTIITSLVIVNTKTKERLSGIEEGVVTYNPIPQKVIAEFVESGKTFNHSGGFAMQKEPFKSYTKELKGEEEALIGLPKKLTQDLLKKAGF